MPTFLSDPPDSLYLASAVAVLIAFGLWIRYRSRKALYGLAATAVFFLSLVAADLLFDSPREIVIRSAKDFQTDFNTGEWNKVEKHIADNFDRKGRKKADVKAAFEFTKAYNAKVALWSFNRDDVVVAGDTITCGFDAKPEGPEAEAYHRYVRAKFAKGANGKWQVVGYTSYKVLNHAEEEEFGAGW